MQALGISSTEFLGVLPGLDEGFLCCSPQFCLCDWQMWWEADVKGLRRSRLKAIKAARQAPGKYLVLTVLWSVLCVAYTGVPRVILACAKHGLIFTQWGLLHGTEQVGVQEFRLTDEWTVFPSRSLILPFKALLPHCKHSKHSLVCEWDSVWFSQAN